MAMDKRHCLGCEDDFYNGKNPLGVAECWMLKTAQIVKRFWIGTWDTPTTPGAFREAKVPNCYRQKGRHYSDTVPSFVKPEHIVKLGRGDGKAARP